MNQICPCGRPHHPRAVEIPPGLDHLVRHVGDFASFRSAMLAAASADSRLRHWTSREPTDLGVLLIELWAGACAITAFADETTAHEAYIRTARQQLSVERLVGLLGARPRGAVGAVTELSMRARGRRPVPLAAGTQFRSGAVDGHPPQIFELLRDITVHPLTNGFDVAVEPETFVAGGTADPVNGVSNISTLRVLQDGAGLARGALLKVTIAGTPQFLTIDTATPVRGPGPTRLDLTWSPTLVVPDDTPWTDVAIDVADAVDRLWTMDVGTVPQAGVSSSATATALTLESLSKDYVKGDEVVVSRDDLHRWFTVDAVSVVPRRLTEDISYTVDDGDYSVAGATAPVTQLQLNALIDDTAHRDPADTDTWDDSIADELIVHGRWRRVATPEVPAAASVAGGAGALPLEGPLDSPVPEHHPQRFAVVDRDGRAVLTSGVLDWANDEVELDHDTWDPPLRHPLRVDANVATATRGESVVGEALGSGDAAAINQRFELANAPLTHLGPDATGGGVPATSTLVVRVDGVEWTELPSFISAGPTDEVYITETAPDGLTAVVFGDGVAGARVPTGVGNVVADYRFGGGAIHPGPGSIAQLVEPVEQITGVVNRAAALGGADPESADDLRRFGPPSALLLDRAISIADFEAAVASSPDVIATAASYEWEPDRLRSAVVIRYIGDANLAAGLTAGVRALAERNTPVSVVAAPAESVTIKITVAADPRRLEADIEAAVVDALLGDGGALTPAVLGVNGPIVRSRLLAAIVGVDGVDHVIDVSVDHAPFTTTAVVPSTGAYFDVTDTTEITMGEAVT
ncbi:MAG: hypothetical protein GY713_11700 [Actinomycetia bacterium]|nr:hypothetical protein [Actinomycetes bacterium]